MTFSEIWKSSKWLIILLLAFWLVSGVFLLIYGKIAVQLYMNRFYCGFFDDFFRYWTLLGSGFVALLIIVFILVFINLRLGILLAIANVTAGLITQALKRLIFSDVMRPAAVLKNLHLVQGVDIHYYNSFPSGHTTTAFALFFALALLLDKKWAKCLFFFIAILVGYSRIYLSQHFLSDVLVGSIIGSVIFLLTLWLFGDKWQKLDKAILTLNKKDEK